MQMNIWLSMIWQCAVLMSALSYNVTFSFCLFITNAYFWLVVLYMPILCGMLSVVVAANARAYSTCVERAFCLMLHSLTTRHMAHAVWVVAPEDTAADSLMLRFCVCLVFSSRGCMPRGLKSIMASVHQRNLWNCVFGVCDLFSFANCADKRANWHVVDRPGRSMLLVDVMCASLSYWLPFVCSLSLSLLWSHPPTSFWMRAIQSS